MKHKVVITGGTGFIGSHLIPALLQAGYSVCALVRNRAQVGSVHSEKDSAWIETDFSLKHLEEILRESEPATVIHLASYFVADHSSEEVDKLVSSNIILGARLLEAMSLVGCRRLLNTGTVWQHFSGEDYDPVCLYAATKQAFQDILEFYVQARQFSALTLKFSDTYGPRDSRNKLIPKLLKQPLSSEPLKLSPGEQILDLIHIDDVVRGYLRAMELLQGISPGRGVSYQMRSAQQISLRELVTLIGQMRGADLPVEWGGRPYRAREVMIPRIIGDNLPGWSSSISHEQGLRELIDSF